MCQVPGSLPGALWSVLTAQWRHYCHYSHFTAEAADTDKVKECDPGPAACDGGGSRWTQQLSSRPWLLNQFLSWSGGFSEADGYGGNITDLSVRPTWAESRLLCNNTMKCAKKLDLVEPISPFLINVDLVGLLGGLNGTICTKHQAQEGGTSVLAEVRGHSILLCLQLHWKNMNSENLKILK